MRNGQMHEAIGTGLNTMEFREKAFHAGNGL